MTQREMQTLAMQLQGGEDPPWKQGVKDMANKQIWSKVNAQEPETLLDNSSTYTYNNPARVFQSIAPGSYISPQQYNQNLEDALQGKGKFTNLAYLDNYIRDNENELGWVTDENGRPREGTPTGPPPYVSYGERYSQSKSKLDELTQVKNKIWQKIKLEEFLKQLNQGFKPKNTTLNQF